MTGKNNGDLPEEVYIYGKFKPIQLSDRHNPDAVKYIRSDLAAPSQWRSMESAPRDGTYFLLYRKSYGNTTSTEKIRIARYRKDGWISIFGESTQHPDNRFYTHWMPLPAPPTKDLADAGKEKT